MGASTSSSQASEEREGGAGMVPSGVSGALSSLWSTSSDEDNTCVQWGLVRISGITFLVEDFVIVFQSKKERIIGFFSCLCLGLICFGLVR